MHPDETRIPDDRPLLEWSRRWADSAFIAFHPFFRLPGAETDLVDHGSSIWDVSDLSDRSRRFVLPRLIQTGQQGRDQSIRPRLDPGLVKRQAEVVPWRTVMEGLRIGSTSGLASALLESILALRARERSSEGPSLLAFVRQSRLFPPVEGRIPPLLERPLGECLAAVGQRHVVISDEFNAVRIRVPARRLVSQTSAQEDVPHCSRLFSETGDVFIASHWDSFWTVITGPKALISAVGAHPLIEGLAVGSDTSNAWWRPTAG